MTKLEKIHYNNGVNDLEYIESAAEITTDIAVKFLKWYETSDFVAIYQSDNRVYPTMDGSHNLIIQKQRKELFEEFINNHYERK